MERQEGLLQRTVHKTIKNNRRGKLDVSSGKLEISREHLPKDGHNKGQRL